MRGTRAGRRWVGVAVLGLVGLGAVGCVHTGPHVPPGGPIAAGPPPIAVPPQGVVPRELEKITLPPYVIEAPDRLLIEVFVRGQVAADGDNGGKAEDKKDAEPAPWPKSMQTRGLPIQQVTGEFLVRMDGSVGLGFWGSVPVAGLTIDQAAAAVRNHLLTAEPLQRLGVKADNLYVIVDVLAYNSKRYYVVTDGGGYGEQVYPFTIYGSETVLDAISNINGLPAVASKRNIWVARRCPHPGHPWQILPVDWVGITQHGITVTNYQILPGDRIYVKAQKLVTIDTALARIISPIERVFGITLLGATTVNQIQGRVGGLGGQ